MCFHKTVHNKWCLDKIIGQIENDLDVLRASDVLLNTD